jgi:transketolase
LKEHNDQFDQLAINTLRFLAVDGVQKANSGHPGMPMGCSPIAYFLYTKVMHHNPKNPKWLNRDRFVLSAGHGSMLLYGILHLCGYDIPMYQLKQFRQWNSITPGHPEFGLTPGVETTTGPLGQGFTNAVGMAWAQAHVAARFNKDDIKLIDHYIYGICSDGDLEEGISHEAASLAGHLKLGKLIFFYDDNGISIDGETRLSFSDDTSKRFEAYHWHVQHVADVNDLSALDAAVKNAQADPRPSIIVTKTHIGYGSPNKQDKESSHGSPLGAEEVKLTKQNLKWVSEEPFFVPDEVRAYFNSLIPNGQKAEAAWNEIFAQYKAKYPEDATIFEKAFAGDTNLDWTNILPKFADDGKKLATRQASGKVINALSKALPLLFGGSADLAPSNNTLVAGEADFSASNYAGKNLHFGIREHGMASIMNGMAMYGGLIPYGGTFMVFVDYFRPTIRLAALSHVRPIYVLTHDSIGLGEDGPTHQPVEQIASLRCIPGLTTIRPADANETAGAWKVAIEKKNGPVALLLTRQGIPILDPAKHDAVNGVAKGAYIIKDSQGTPDIILIGSGSELQHCIKAGEQLEAEGVKVRVVSFPSWDLFEKQSAEYKESVLPKAVKKRVAIEANIGMGWDKYTGDEGVIISLERFGASAPFEILMKEFGFTAENVLAKAKTLLGK